MDEKMEQAIEAFFANLTDDQKAKAKECKTMEELMDFAGKEGLELPDELLDNVAGGWTVRQDFEELRRRLFGKAE